MDNHPKEVRLGFAGESESFDVKSMGDSESDQDEVENWELVSEVPDKRSAKEEQLQAQVELLRVELNGQHVARSALEAQLKSASLNFEEERHARSRTEEEFCKIQAILETEKRNADVLRTELQLERQGKAKETLKVLEVQQQVEKLTQDLAELKQETALKPASPEVEEVVEQLAEAEKYTCASCRVDVAGRSSFVWKGTMGNPAVDALLFKKTVNVQVYSAPRLTSLSTGTYKVADVRCTKCECHLGWRYLEAFSQSNKYKEGCTILEEGTLAKAL